MPYVPHPSRPSWPNLIASYPPTFPLTSVISEHLILLPCSACALSKLTLQAVHLYEDKAKGASLLISRTNSSFSIRGVLGPDRAISPRPDRPAPPLPTHDSGHQIPDGIPENDPSRHGSAQIPDGSPEIDPSAQNIPPHWVTTAIHPLPGTDYQVDTASGDKSMN